MYCMGEWSDLSEKSSIWYMCMYIAWPVLVTKCMVMTYLTKAIAWILCYTVATCMAETAVAIALKQVSIDSI